VEESEGGVVEKRVVGRVGRGGEGGGGIITPVEGAYDEDEGAEGVGLAGAWGRVGLTAARCRLTGRGLFSPEELVPAEPVVWGKAGVFLVCVWCGEL
jgi:hypothetical protein